MTPSQATYGHRHRDRTSLSPQPLDQAPELLASARLSGNAVALVVKSYAEAACLDPEEFAGHSLRAGLITTAAENGVQERTIAKQSRHRSLEVLRRYIREGSLYRENAASSVGL